MYHFLYKLKTFDSITNTTKNKISFFLKTNRNKNYRSSLVKKGSIFSKLKNYFSFREFSDFGSFFFKTNRFLNVNSLLNFSTITYEIKTFKVRFLRKKTSLFDRFNTYRFFAKKRWYERKYLDNYKNNNIKRYYRFSNNPFPRNSRDNFKRRNQFMRKIFFKNSWIKTLWRKREEVKKLLSLKFRYQKKFTRYVTQFRGKVSLLLLKYNYFNLLHIIRSTNIVVSNTIGRELLNEGCVYLNNINTRNGKIVLVKGDLVSLRLSWCLLSYLTYQRSIYGDHLRKFNRMYYGFLMKRKKDKGFVHWQSYFDFFKKPTPSFLEVDLLSLNFMVLKEVDNNVIQRKTDSLALPYNAFQLLNWKFII